MDWQRQKRPYQFMSSLSLQSVSAESYRTQYSMNLRTSVSLRRREAMLSRHVHIHFKFIVHFMRQTLQDPVYLANEFW